jgi:hypothetical protein
MRRPPLSRLAPLAGALALLATQGGCARRPPVPPDENTPQHQACRAEAQTAPAVRALDREVNPSAAPVGGRIEYEKYLAEMRAYRDCLRRAGLTLPGGVEPVIPRDFGTDPILPR